MRLSVFVAILGAQVAFSSINDGAPISVAPKPNFGFKEGRIKEKSCYPSESKFPDDLLVLAAGAYLGRELGFQIDLSGHEATQIDVIVNSPTKPVALMLGAYEPTLWNISWTEKSNIAAIMVSGIHKQEIIGLGKDVPVIISTDENLSNCGVFYIDESQLTTLNPISRRHFNQKIDKVYFANGGYVTIGDKPSFKDNLIQFFFRKPEFYRKNSPSGLQELKQAVENKYLRKANREDALVWVKEVNKKLKLKDIRPVAGKESVLITSPVLTNAYVVLKNYRYPGGLFGSNSAVFFIPKGVPKPSGSAGHSTIYDFDTLSCTGSFCNID